MKRYGTLIAAALCGVTLDCTMFAEWNIFGAKPWLLLAVALAACAVLDVQSAILTGLVGGLMIDALCNSYIGLTAACYLVSIAALWVLIRKNHPKLLILGLYAAFVTVLPAPIEWLYSYLAGAHYGTGSTFLAEVLPSAVLTGLCVLPLCKLFDWAKKSHRDRI